MNAKVLIALAAFACALTIARVFFEPGLPPYRPAVRLSRYWPSIVAPWAAALRRWPHLSLITPGRLAIVVPILLIGFALLPWSIPLAALAAFVLVRIHFARTQADL